ncbi:MAG: hypothetical protein WC929_00365 [Bacilli bacterium]|jgi:DNA modification methylase
MGKLSEKFGLPPFSVFDARQGVWQDRKRWWISLGIQSELGRGENCMDMSIHVAEDGLNYYRKRPELKNGLLGISEQARSHYKGGNPQKNCAPGGSLRPAANYSNRERGDGTGKPIKHYARCFGQDLMKGENDKFGNRLTWVAGSRPLDALDDVSSKILDVQPQSGTSIFDPVLCELLYKWFTPINGTILDPFAGGSVRGIVANYLGYHYTGIDLRPEQIAANNIQADNILKDQEKPTWIIGDSKNIDNLIPETTFEGFLTCPPYFNLELYSDDENDISNCDTYDSFIDNYNEIIQKSVAKLNNNRFACIVVGDIRDKAGFYHGFVCDTIDAFENAGMKLYNDAILVTAVGSLPIRVGRQFGSYRKLGKTHQNVLIFFKGNPKQIPIDFAMPESVTNEEQDLFSFT